MKLGPRKIVALVVLLVVAGGLGGLVVAEALDLAAALILGALVVVVLLIAFVDARQARRLARVEHRLAARLDATRAKVDDVGRHLSQKLEQIRATNDADAPTEAVPPAFERALRDLEARQTRGLQARTERLEQATDQQRRALERRLDRVDRAATSLGSDLESARQQLMRVAKRHDDNRRQGVRLLQASMSLNQELAGDPALPHTSTWAAASDLLFYLYRLVGALQPERILECGSGVSSAVMGLALPGHGQIVTLENDATFGAKTRTWVDALGLSERVTVVDAPLVDTHVDDEHFQWYDLAGLPAGPPAGLLVVDGPWGAIQAQARLPAVSCLRRYLADDVVVVLDDADRQDEIEIVDRWRALLPGHELVTLSHDKGTAVLAPPDSIALRLE